LTKKQLIKIIITSKKTKLTLTLLKARVFLVDNVNFSIATYDFTIYATLFYGSSNFHNSKINVKSLFIYKEKRTSTSTFLFNQQQSKVKNKDDLHFYL
jgi:hypothetical protein